MNSFFLFCLSVGKLQQKLWKRRFGRGGWLKKNTKSNYKIWKSLSPVPLLNKRNGFDGPASESCFSLMLLKSRPLSRANELPHIHSRGLVRRRRSIGSGNTRKRLPHDTFTQILGGSTAKGNIWLKIKKCELFDFELNEKKISDHYKISLIYSY